MKSDAFKSLFKNCPLIYIPWEGSPLDKQKNFSRMLELLEIKVDDLQAVIQPTQFDRIILPDESFISFGSRRFTAEYRDTIDRLRDFALRNRTPTSNKKIYHFNGRKSVGENRIAEYFKSKGYEIIQPEKLTVDDQLNWLINCESFASVGCSCAHNSLFLRDGTETIFIPRAASRFEYYQEIVNQVHPLNVNYVDSCLSIFSKAIWAGNHCYIISKQLKRFFGDKADEYEEEDFKTFLPYVKNSLNKGLEFNRRMKNYYEPTLSDFLAQLRKHEDLMVAYDMPTRWEYFRPLLNYQTHVHSKGWGSWNSEEEISNSLDQKLDIQAIKINFSGHKIFYSVYYNDQEGWSEEVLAPEMAGTTGKTKAIYGIRIRLDEAGAKEFDILYRVHKFDNTWTAWAKNGEAIYSHGVKLNAIQIKLEPAN